MDKGREKKAGVGSFIFSVCVRVVGGKVGGAVKGACGACGVCGVCDLA